MMQPCRAGSCLILDQAVDLGVCQLADAVAEIGRPEHRQHQIWTAADSPDGKSLTEVFCLARQIGVLGGVDDTGQSQRAVDDETTGLAGGAEELALQQMIGDVDRLFQVIEEIGHREFYPARHDRVITLRHRPQDESIEGVVDGVDAPVHGFQRIVGFL